MKKPRKRKGKAKRQRRVGQRRAGQGRAELTQGLRAGRRASVLVAAAKPSTPVFFAPAFSKIATSWIDFDDDRSAFALLLAPFIIMAFALAGNVSMQTNVRFDRVVAERVISNEITRGQPVVVDSKPTISLSRAPVLVGQLDVLAPVLSADVRLAMSDIAPSETPELARVGKKEFLARGFVVHSVSRGESVKFSFGAGELARHSHARSVASIEAAPGTKLSLVGHSNVGIDRLLPVDGSVVSQTSTLFGVPQAARVQVVEGGTLMPVRGGDMLSASKAAQFAQNAFVATAVVATVLLNGDVRNILPERSVCVASGNVLGTEFKQGAANLSSSVRSFGQGRVVVGEGRVFGVALARAARRQTKDFVIYNDKYMAIRFPMGDVPPLYGVCTDVVIRAYRTLGIDLQNLVFRSRIGNGDRSINHRRTRTLKSFFGRFGERVAITQYLEDYLPGDIVTYYRPQNRGSKMHIGIVADVIAPSGRPMIVHNRGWGPQMEDALFVDEITGHYRYRGPGATRARTVATSHRPTAHR